MRGRFGGAAVARAALVAGLVAGAALTPRAAAAQVSVFMESGPEVGAVAPDFTLPGSTRFGLLTQPVRLSDFRGKTVVLAFFFRSRTRG